MILTDMNQSWKAPEGYECTGLRAEGAFLVLTYQKDLMVVTIYLNDQGREVIRYKWTWTEVSSEPLATAQYEKSLSLWELIELWFRTYVLGE